MFVVEVSLKTRDFDTRVITPLAAKHSDNDNMLDSLDQIIESYSNEKKITTHIL